MFSTALSHSMPSLHEAARDGNLDVLKQHIDNGCDINLKNAEGLTALMLAAQNGHVPTINYLLSRGADATAADPASGHTAFFMAVLAGQTQVLKHMIDAGADVCSAPGTSALMLAVEMESFELTKFLLEAGVNVNAKRSHDQSTALMLAAMHGKQDIVELLLAHGAEVDAKNHQGSTALGWAVECEQPEVVQVLLEAGADANATNAFGESVMSSAYARGQKKIIGLLLAKIGQATKHLKLSFHQAAEEGELEIFKQHIESGMDINMLNEYGDSPLLLATRNGHGSITHYLLEKGADVNVPLFKLPLVAAAKGGYTDLVKMLLSAGARRWFLRDGWKLAYPLKEAMGAAARCGHKEIVEILLAAGGEHLHVCKNEAFQEAVTSGQTEIVEFLFSTGFEGLNLNKAWDNAIVNGQLELIRVLLVKAADSVNINKLLAQAIRCKQTKIFKLLWAVGRETADINALLRTAASFNNKEIVIFLLTQGADIHAMSVVEPYSYNALMCAVSEGGGDLKNNIEMVKLLLDSGADVNARWPSGDTALMLASLFTMNSKEVVSQLLAAGAQVNAIDNEGKTALIMLMEPKLRDTSCSDAWCRHCRNPERQAKAKLLLAHGADLYIKDNAGKTAIDYAASDPELQKWLIHEYAWYRRRHAICFYARRHHAAEPAITASL